jgi:short-subunit dehydrogenase
VVLTGADDEVGRERAEALAERSVATLLTGLSGAA